MHQMISMDGFSIATAELIMQGLHSCGGAALTGDQSCEACHTSISILLFQLVRLSSICLLLSQPLLALASYKAHSMHFPLVHALPRCHGWSEDILPAVHR